MKRKFADGGEAVEMIPQKESTLDALASGDDPWKYGGRFGTDTYDRAKKFLAQQAEAEKAPVKAKAKAKAKPSSPRMGPPGGALRGRADAKLSDAMRPGTRVSYDNEDTSDMTYKKGGKTKKYAKGGSVSSRADGIAQRGKTRGKMC
jgi:hypothetical protein